MEVLVALSLVVAVVSSAFAVLALRNQRRLRRACRLLTAGGREDVLALLDRHAQEAEALRREVDALQRDVEAVRALAAAGLSRVATLRYDAFSDTGGRMSFSTALLNADGNGLVLSSINGRTEARTYAKPIIGGESRHVLSDEEREVVARAVQVEPVLVSRSGDDPTRIATVLS